MTRPALTLGLALMASACIAPTAYADQPGSRLLPHETRVRACIIAAAEIYRFPAAVIVLLLQVEGGRLGATTANTNETSDIGPMQVNTVWVPKVAEHWRTSVQAAYLALRDNFCANVEAGSWILRLALDEAHGDLWSGVGIYHSHNPVHQDAYLRQVLRWATRLRDEARSRQALADARDLARPVEAPAGSTAVTARVASR